MRFLALEANTRKLKRQFIADGEEELLSTTRHVFAFLVPMLWIIPVGVLALGTWTIGVAEGWLDPVLFTALLYLVFLILFVFALRAFINWRYNIVVITTEKIVVIMHDFVFKQTVTPYNLDGVGSASAGTRYLGLGNCGYVDLYLSAVQSGTSVTVRLELLPKPSVVAGAIESARVLRSQRSPADKGLESQERKVEEVQAKAEVQLPGTATAPVEG